MFVLTISMFTIEYDKLGNIQGIEIPSYNIITETDDIIIMEMKNEAQIKLLLEVLDASL